MSVADVQTRCLNTDCLKMLFSSSSDAAGQNDDVVFGKSVFCQHLNVTKCCDLNLEKLFHGYCTLGAWSQLQMGYIRTEKCNIVSSEMHQILNMSCSTESAHSLICCVPHCTKEVKC